ncbi:MAG: NMD3-related protein [Candidatus Micrarchaeaceae archaeon]
MSKRCPTCGRTSDNIQFYGQFCKKCKEKTISELLPTFADIILCKNCGKIRFQGRFVKDTGQNMQELLQSIFKNYKIVLIDYNVDDSTAGISFGKEEGSEIISVDKKIELRFKKTLCENCNRRAGSYYEAVMQLRGNNERMERFIERVNKYFERRGEFIAKVKKVDNGYDVYLSNKKLASAYISSHNLESVNSYTLYGVKHGKKVFRHTHSIRL